MAMASDVLARSFGKEAFGLDPQNYHTARPAYPELVWDALRNRAGLRRGISILEIGAGTGLATERLLEDRPHRLLAVEPDRRLARFLRGRLDKEELEVVETPFEKLKVPEKSFDLVVSATAFHWIDAAPALRRIHRLLRAGGTVALFGMSSGTVSGLIHFIGRRLTCSQAIVRAHPVVERLKRHTASMSVRDWVSWRRLVSRPTSRSS